MDRVENTSREMAIYQIKIDGKLQGVWEQWLNSTIINVHETTRTTVISTAVPDQAALRGLLNKLWDLNLTILSMTKHEDVNEIGEQNAT